MSLEPYPEYKDSNFGWLGKIPTGWDIYPLWFVFMRTKKLGTGSEELLSVYRDHGVVPKASRDDNFNKASDDLSKYQVVSAGDLVINKMKAWQGSVAVSEHDGIVSPAYFVYKCLSHVDIRFMHYLMRSTPYFQHYASISSGIRPNQWDLDPNRHRVMPVLVPDYNEQRKIAEFLDQETAEVDAFIADQEELIVLLAERRRATIAHAVTKGLNPDALMKDSGVEWIGSLPSHWNVHKATWVGRVFSSEPTGEPEFDDSSRIPFLKVSSLSPKNFKPAPYRWFVPPTRNLVRDFIVFPKRGAAIFGNKVNVVDGAAVMDPNLMGWKLNSEHSRAYFAYVLKSLKLEEIADVSTVPQINTKHMSALQIPVPDFSSQSVIANYLDQETERIDAAVSDAREAISLSKERRAALISAAVTGKTDVRRQGARASMGEAVSVGVA